MIGRTRRCSVGLVVVMALGLTGGARALPVTPPVDSSVPAAPSMLAAAATVPPPSRVTLIWTDNSSRESGFRIERRLAGQGAFATVGSGPRDFTFFLDQGPLQVDASYEYRVVAESASGDSAPSNVVAVATAPFPPDGTPSDLVATVVDWHRVDLSWSDNATNEHEYVVVRDQFNGPEVELTAPANATTLVDTSTEGDALYVYSVVARNPTATSAPSETVAVTTPPSPQPPAPSDVRVRRRGTTGTDGTAVVELTWRDNADTELSYRVLRSGEDPELDFELVEKLPPDSTSFVDTEAQAGFAYAYRLMASDPVGFSDDVTLVVPPVPEEQLVVDARPLPVPDLEQTGIFRDVATLGDLNGDGVDDLAVGAPSDGFDAPAKGAVYVLFLDEDGGIRQRARIGGSSPPLVGRIGAADDWGYSVTGPGDVDGDGIPDLAVGAPGARGGEGAVWVLLLRRDGTVAGAVETRGSAIDPVAYETGRSLATVGDVDGLGTDELVVGLYDAAAVLFLDGGGALTRAQIISDSSEYATIDDGFDPTEWTGGFGHAASGLGDLDGDGVPDAAVSNAFLRYGVWLLFLERSGRVRDWVRIPGGELTGSEPVTPFLGISLACVGDLDGDGSLELAVGAEQGRETGAGGGGRIHFFSLVPDGTVLRDRFLSPARGGFGGMPDADVGRALAAIPDVDGDGVIDLVAGYPGSDTSWLLSLNGGRWTDVGGELASSGATPELLGRGRLLPTAEITLTLDGAAPLAPVLLVIGGDEVSLAFKDGVLVPRPDIVVTDRTTDAEGLLSVEARWPVGLGTGIEVWYQAWIVDAAAPAGLSASNAITSKAP